jgi:hypothetical protein
MCRRLGRDDVRPTTARTLGPSPGDSARADGHDDNDGPEDREQEEDMDEALGVRPGVDGVVLGRR